jgi:hypothetical protein
MALTNLRGRAVAFLGLLTKKPRRKKKEALAQFAPTHGDGNLNWLLLTVPDPFPELEAHSVQQMVRNPRQEQVGHQAEDVRRNDHVPVRLALVVEMNDYRTRTIVSLTFSTPFIPDI